MAQGSRQRGRVIILLALVIILIVAVAYLYYTFVMNKPATTAQTPPVVAPQVVQEEMVDIVITTQPVSRGATFTNDILTTIKYPKKEVVEGVFFNSTADVVGKISMLNIEARVPVTHTMVLDKGSVNAKEVPIGMVAISIPLRNRVSAISYAPQPGDHVNVIAMLSFVDLDTDFQTKLPNKVGLVTAPSTGSPASANAPATPAELTVKVTGDATTGAPRGKAEQDSTLGQPLYVIPSEPQRARLVSQTLVQDAIVLQIGDFMTQAQLQQSVAKPTPTPVPSGGGTETQPQPVVQATPVTPSFPDTVTLVVAPQDAVTLNYLVYAGAQLTLVLRGTGDNQRVQTEAVTMQYLMDQYNIPVPAKMPYGMEVITDLTKNCIALPSQYGIPGTGATICGTSSTTPSTTTGTSTGATSP
jgi:Flp pilus assembly protein CpaB